MATAAKDLSAAKFTSKESQLKSYQKKARDEIKVLVDNFVHILNLAKPDMDDKSQLNSAAESEQVGFEMKIRSANMVRAAESLNKLVADIQQFVVLNDYPSVNESIASYGKAVSDFENETNKTLNVVRDSIAVELYTLEEEYDSCHHHR